MQIVNCYLCRAVIDKNYNLNSYSWFNIIQQVNKNYFEYLLNNLRCNLRHREGLNTNVVGRKYSHVFAIILLFSSCNVFWGISQLKQKDKQNKKYILTSSTSILLSFCSMAISLLWRSFREYCAFFCSIVVPNYQL